MIRGLWIHVAKTQEEVSRRRRGARQALSRGTAEPPPQAEANPVVLGKDPAGLGKGPSRSTIGATAVARRAVLGRWKLQGFDGCPNRRVVRAISGCVMGMCVYGPRMACLGRSWIGVMSVSVCVGACRGGPGEPSGSSGSSQMWGAL